MFGKDTNSLAYGLISHRYRMGKNFENLFTIIGIPEYVILHRIAGTDLPDPPDRVYLADLAERSGHSVRETSRLVGGLKEQGLVIWSHDGDGSEGTYVTVTPQGQDALRRQEQVLSDYCDRVFRVFGRENIVSLLQQLDRLEDIMDSECGEVADHDE